MFSPGFFWDQDGIILIDYLPKGQTINAEYYWSLLVQLKDILKEKRQRRRKGSKWVLFLHDNAPANLHGRSLQGPQSAIPADTRAQYLVLGGISLFYLQTFNLGLQKVSG